LSKNLQIYHWEIQSHHLHCIMNSSVCINHNTAPITIESKMTKSHDQNNNLSVLKLTRKVSDERENRRSVSVLSCSSIPRKKQRQSFSMKTKLAWVKEYQLNPSGTNMRGWLDKKNIVENTKVSYTSFRRWNSTLQNMTNKDIMSYSSPYSKKNSVRPHDEMEKVLIDFLIIRNHRLRSSGRRKSTPGYIKAKAIEFYGELYGDDATHKFKASNGWLSRFQDAYRHLLDPDSLNQRENTEKDQNSLSCKEELNASCEDSEITIENDFQESDCSQEYREENPSLFGDQKLGAIDVAFLSEQSCFSSLDCYLDQPLTEREMEFMREGITS
jgi:hypothetical protein